jgi:hypothetical protein
MNAQKAFQTANEVLTRELLSSEVNIAVRKTLHEAIEKAAKGGWFSTTVHIDGKHSQRAIAQLIRNDGFAIDYNIGFYGEQFGGGEYTNYEISWY